MSGLLAALRLDVRLQARHRLYPIGIVVAVLVGAAARAFFEPAYMGRLIPAFYMMAIGGTTYIFVASMVLLEKGEGTLSALRTSPLTARDYVLSKALTLTTFATVESTLLYALAAAGSGAAAPSPLPLLAGVGGLGLFLTFLGLGQVASYDAVTEFLFPDAVVVGVLLQLPVFWLIGVGPPALWYALPTQGPMLLMVGAFEPLAPWQWAYAICATLAAAAAAGWWARRRFVRVVGLQGSGR